MKFGGTSVADARSFERVGRIIGERKHERPVVVVSAMSKVTDALLKSVRLAASGDASAATRALEPHLDRHMEVARVLFLSERAGILRALEEACLEIAGHLQAIAARVRPLAVAEDLVASYGERLSAALLAATLREGGLSASYVDSRRCITTDNRHGNATPLLKACEARTRHELGEQLKVSSIPVLGGFIGMSADGETTTLGRNGSDYSASIIGVALASREIQIWTDVSGMMTADPRLVKNAQNIPELSYEEAAELAYFGAKVLHHKMIQPVAERRIPVRILNSHAAEDPGTLVCADGSTTLLRPIKAIAHKTRVSILHVFSKRVLNTGEFLKRVVNVFKRHSVVIDVMVTSESNVSLSFENTTALASIVEELSRFSTVRIETGRALVCVVGKGLCAQTGVIVRALRAISGIHTSLISQGASGNSLILAIAEEEVGEAVMRLHKALFNESPKSSDLLTITRSQEYNDVRPPMNY